MNRPPGELPLIEDSLSNILRGPEITYGLPKEEVQSVCTKMYKNDIVKITLQISEPEAQLQELVKDVRVSFADALGLVGKEMLSHASFGNLKKTDMHMI